MRTLLALLLVSFSLLRAQPAKFTHVEDGDEHMSHGNYLMAIPIYKAELKKDWDNIKIEYKLGICYLNTRVNRAEAIPLLEKASKSPKIEEDVWLHLGRAYALSNRIEDAVKAFETYRNKGGKRVAAVTRYLEECANAKHFMQNPTTATFHNLGKDINSDEPDYNPFVDRDENFLVFTSRRKDNIGGKKQEVDGYRNSDIYQCSVENAHWSSARNCGRGVNGSLDEQVTGLRPDGMEMYLYVDHIEKVGDIYYSVRKEPGTDFIKPKPFDETVNEEFETSGAVTPSGDVIFFGRKPDNKDNVDIFMCRRLPNGAWGEAIRLPDQVNTKYNEDAPYLSHDGKTLYFSSDGHNTMGGYDLFMSRWDQQTNTFSKAENLGFPINSTDDDRSICVTADNKFAYVSAYRPNGFGDLDIYRVRLTNSDPISVIYTGQLFLGDTIPANQPNSYSASIIVTDTKTNYEYTFVPHSKTGRFVMALPAGTYKLTSFCKGFVKYSEDLVVDDVGKRNQEWTKNILMKKSKKVPK